MSGPAILVLDDDLDVLKAAAFLLGETCARVDTLSRGQDLESALSERTYDAVLLDMNFSVGRRDGGEGLEALARVQAADPTLSVVLMTAYAGVAMAVAALKSGAVDFIVKPWRNDKLLAAVDSAVALTRGRRQGAEFDLELIERHAIERALERYDGNISKAATALGLTRPALYRRMSKHGL